MQIDLETFRRLTTDERGNFSYEHFAEPLDQVKRQQSSLISALGVVLERLEIRGPHFNAADQAAIDLAKEALRG